MTRWIAFLLLATAPFLAAACEEEEDGREPTATVEVRATDTAEPQGELDLEQYFAEVQRAASEFAESAAYDDVVAQLDALEPPAEVAGEHQGFVAALRELAAAMTSAGQGTPVDLNDLNDRAIETCLALQAVADQHAIAEYLHCDPHLGGLVSNPSPDPGETVDVTVSVSDGGEPRQGVECTITILSQPGDDASLGSEKATTDENGEATVPLDVGGSAGTIEVEADCEGLTQEYTVEVGAGALAPERESR